MKDTKKAVVGLIRNEEQKLLLIRPSDKKNFGRFQNAWYPPGGHVQEGETEKAAIVREIKEELNLDTKPRKLISEWEQDVPGETGYWWEMRVVGGQIKLSDEIAEYGWFSPDEIRTMKLWPAERKFFKKFLWK